MGKSPGKWIKNVFLGKKSSKSSLSKDAISEIKVSATGNTQSKYLGPDSMVISSPVRPIIDSNEEHTELENNPVSNNLITETREEIRAPMDLNSMNSEELIKLEQAATKAQAAFRGYLARRAFWALKGIIRLQALVRGHLVRRQAVATLKCMRAIVEFQALVRGRTVRISGNGQLLQKHSSREFVDKKSSELLLTSLREEKLSKNVFATKLVASSHTTVPLSFQYEPTEPNSVRNWLDRWSTSHFWDPLPQPKKIPDSKPKRKQTKIQSEETETTKPKRIIRNNNNLSNSSENEKSRRTVRKPTHHQIEPVQDQSLNELEKVKRNLRKISLSSTSEIEKTEKTEKIEKTEKSENTEMPLVLDEGIKINGSHVESVKEAEVEVEAEVEAVPPVVIEEKPVEVTEDENLPINEKVPLNGKEEHGSSKENNQKTRRRKSLPPKQEYNESVSPNTPTLPSYMAATESAKAKLRAQKAAEEAAAAAVENGGSRRQSLPAAGGKLSLNSTSPSPRVHKPVHVNGKGGSKPNKSQISPRDEKVLQAGWRR